MLTVEPAGAVLDGLIRVFREHRLLAGQIALASIVVAAFYAILMFVVVARMSPDYFLSKRPSKGSWRNRHPVTRFVVRVAKNALGSIFLISGVAMLVLPGQGLLTILVGISLLEFPGKRKLELRIVRQRPVLRAINWIRARVGRPPLVVPAGE